jgi:hypothetical protein
VRVLEVGLRSHREEEPCAIPGGPKMGPEEEDKLVGYRSLALKNQSTHVAEPRWRNSKN